MPAETNLLAYPALAFSPHPPLSPGPLEVEAEDTGSGKPDQNNF